MWVSRNSKRYQICVINKGIGNHFGPRMVCTNILGKAFQFKHCLSYLLCLIFFLLDGGAERQASRISFEEQMTWQVCSFYACGPINFPVLFGQEIAFSHTPKIQRMAHRFSLCFFLSAQQQIKKRKKSCHKKKLFAVVMMLACPASRK